VNPVAAKENRVRQSPTGSAEAQAARGYETDDLDGAYAALVLFAGIVAAGIALSGYVCRLGFADNSVYEWATYVGVSWFLLHFSIAARMFLRTFGVTTHNHWWASHALLGLAALSLMALSGVEQTTIALSARAVFVVVGTVAFVASSVSLLRLWPWRNSATLIGFAVFFALYAIGASWGIGYQNPLLVEGICFGHAQIDTLYHATIANMIRTYGVPSTGLDGLPYILYHVGSHWLFARLSNLINIPVIDFYNRAYAVIFVPFGLSSLGIFATAMIPRWQSFAEMGMAEIAPEAAQRQTGALRIGPLFWFVLVAAYVGLLPYAAGYLPIIARNSVIVSESYAVAVAVSLLGAAAVVSYFRDSYNSPDLWMADRVLGIFLLSAVAGAAGFFKISVMLVLIAASGFLFFRVRPYLYRSGAAATLLATATLAAAFAYPFVSNPAYDNMTGFVPFGFLRTNVDPQWWPYFWLVYYAWLWIFTALRLREEGVRTIRELRTSLREGRLLDLEFLLAVAFAGTAPGLVLATDSSHYFSDYQQWMAVGFLLATLTRNPIAPQSAESVAATASGAGGRPARQATRPWSERFTVAKAFAVVLVLAIAGTLISNVLVLLNGTLSTVLASQGFTLEKPDARVELLESGFDGARRRIAAQDAVIERRFQSDKNILAVLRSLDRTPFSEKRRTLLYIPKTNRHYWDLLHGPYSPKDGPFVATALSGIAMIDGLYIRPEGDFWTGYSYQHYDCPIVNVERPPLEEYLPTLRKRCLEMGFTQLIVIVSDRDGVSHARKYDCRETTPTPVDTSKKAAIRQPAPEEAHREHQLLAGHADSIF